MTTLWFYEDFEIGKGGTTLGRTITDADIVNFAGVSGDFNPAHVVDAPAFDGVFPGRIAQGMLGASAMTGLLTRDAPEVLGTQWAGLAFLGINWRFLAPIRPGDTIHVVHRVASKRPTSTAGRGVIEHEVEVLNQDGAVVQSGTIALLSQMREAVAG
jgi:acyl dehydratase